MFAVIEKSLQHLTGITIKINRYTSESIAKFTLFSYSWKLLQPTQLLNYLPKSLPIQYPEVKFTEKTNISKLGILNVNFIVLYNLFDKGDSLNMFFNIKLKKTISSQMATSVLLWDDFDDYVWGIYIFIFLVFFYSPFFDRLHIQVATAQSRRLCASIILILKLCLILHCSFQCKISVLIKLYFSFCIVYI